MRELFLGALFHLGGLILERLKLFLLRSLASGTLLCGSLLIQGPDTADGGLQEFHADAVLAGLDDDSTIGNSDHAAVYAADGGDPIALLQAVAHILGFFLALVLGTDQHEIENGHHDDDHNERGTQAAACGSCHCEVGVYVRDYVY